MFARLDPAAFARCVADWLSAVCEATGLRHVAIDGKAVRSAPRGTFSGCLHLVSAWATENGLILGQQAVADGSHEIAAIPELLAVLELKGALVTLDAAGCQVGIARQIRAKGGDYLLAVKGNQPNLHEAVRAVFGRADAAGWEGVRFDTHATEGDGHGRHEGRATAVIYDPAGLSPDWPDVVLVGRERSVGHASTFAGQYHIASHAGTAEELGDFARSHWHIENGLHHTRDVTPGEDRCRVRRGRAPRVLASLRNVAVYLLRRAGYRSAAAATRAMVAQPELALALLNDPASISELD